MKKTILSLFLAIAFISLVPVVASASISLLGDEIEGELYTSHYHIDILQGFTTPQTVGSGIEFTGEARAYWDPTIDFDISVDVYDNHFTVGIESTSDWGGVSQIGSSIPLFYIHLFDINGGEDISSVLFNEDLTIGFVGGYNHSTLTNMTATSFTLAFNYVNDGNIYYHDINHANPVPIPGAVCLLAPCVIGVVRFRKHISIL